MAAILNRAKGCIVGACMGDAAGSILEFSTGRITPAIA